MLSTAHVVVGMAVGAATGSPVVGLVAGILSHHLMDIVPHWDSGSFYAPTFDVVEPNRRDLLIATADALVAIGLFVAALNQFGQGQPWPLIAGAAGGLLPDLWHHIPLWSRWSRRVTARWFGIHNHFHHTVEQKQMVWGLLTQVVAVVLGWWWLGLVR